MNINYPKPRKMLGMFISYALKALICLFWIIPFSINFISKIKEINGIVNFKQGMEIFFSPFKNMTQSALIFIGVLSFCCFCLNLISRSNKASIVIINNRDNWCSKYGQNCNYIYLTKLIPSILILFANLSIMFLPILLSAFASSLFFYIKIIYLSF